MEGLSKNQQKKLKRREEWKAKRKATKKKQKKHKNTLYHQSREEWNSRRANGYKIIVDCSFYSIMTEREQNSLKQQLVFSYAALKKADYPVNLVYTGVPSELKEKLDKVSGGNWTIPCHSEVYADLFPKDNLVYLTADSDNTLEHLDPHKVYIIGGLVDHNRLPFITLEKAMRENIETAKLPLSDFVTLKTSSVLTVNHCIDIFLKYQETNDWAESFKCIPSRKFIEEEEKVEVI